MGNSLQFAHELEVEVREFTHGTFRKFRDGLVFEAAAIIDETWPVKTGFSRASNLPFVGDPDGGVRAAAPDPDDFSEDGGTGFGDPIDADKVEAIQAVLKASDPFDSAGISTNVIYAPVLEAGHGAEPQYSHMYELAMQAIKDVKLKGETL